MILKFVTKKVALFFPARDHTSKRPLRCQRRLTAMFHTFHVQRKENVIEANLDGKMVKAQVLVVLTPPPGREGEGDPVVEVHSAEI